MTDEGIGVGAIRARGLGRRFRLRSTRTRSLKDVLLRRDVPATRDLWALREVDLEITPGETFGIVGQNGSGKSTLLSLVAGIFTPTEGTIAVGGRVGSLLELGAGFHPEFSGVENVYLNAAIYGLSSSYVDEHLEEIVSFAELEEFADLPMKTYSSGMYMRLGFAVATHIDADILLLDEVLAVGDEAFQAKCYEKIETFRDAGGTIVFVSHEAAAVERICRHAILLEHGRIAEAGTTDEVLREYHRRLRRRANERAVKAAPTRAVGAEPNRAACEILGVRTIGATGIPRESFFSGEGIVLETKLFSTTGVSAGRFTITLRQDDGTWLASRVLEKIALRPDEIETIALCIPVLPVYEGWFLIDAHVTDEKGQDIATRPSALKLAIVGNIEGAHGPVRFPGEWRLGMRPEQRAVRAIDP